MRQLHWPSGPYPVHSGSTEECQQPWDVLWKRHEYYVECTCGWSAREDRLKDAAAAGSAHYKSLWPQEEAK
jgi:hypothetical protein